MTHICGMYVKETLNAVTRTRAKVYPKRKAKNTSHWKRMDKKWSKRYGYREEPAIFKINDTLFIHPALMPKIRAAIAEENRSMPNGYGNLFL